ncbi:unnamed protein product [Candida verbasci]|uniref:FHA domain-containing protein n=1 Tax=Candida verbasci TaxID=1227364 RepID=A0A9W4X982_9ASCO|nr:unnamed protein product [Candida verbasci]
MSHTNYQFPPSSPLHDVDEYSINDQFAAKKQPGVNFTKGFERLTRDEYPTPNPSSSLFRSSSPAREIENSPKKNDLKSTISINKDFNVLNPDKSVIRIPLLSTHTHFNFGRSSRSCEFAINAKDSYISRIHMKLTFDSEQIIINCVGSNGLTMIIPKNCLIYQTTNSKDNFIIKENKTGNQIVNDYESRSIKLDSNHTEFFMRQGETITLPRFENILIQISKQLILLNPNDVDEELTDEEELQLIDKPRTTTTSTPNTRMENKNVPNTPSKPKQEVNLKIAENKFDETPIKETENSIKPISKTKSETQLSIPPPKSTFKIHQEKQIPNRAYSTSPKLVLSDKTNTKKRASSVEPNLKYAAESTNYQPLKKKKFIKESTPELDSSILNKICNLEEINNILINHLAFSRLSSTPASFLNTISVLTSNLNLSQIRAILHSIECIGIIYRQGKDAAGKPLEEEYYYMPENDDDESRKNLVSNFKGHGGLRSCRKTHKQYYWKKPAPIKK